MAGIPCKAIVVLCLTLGALCGVDAKELAGGLPQRPRPPASLTCTRDHLTVFQGRIIEYTRGKQDIAFRVRTDEETTENFTLKWDTSDNAEKWFLLRGEIFKIEDWKLIESAPGKLHDDMRIFVWVCDDGSKPVLDWRPKEI